MAKTRKLTATFTDGTETTRTTARTYTHVVQVITKCKYTDLNGKVEIHDYFQEHWCGRPDLMKKCISKYQGEQRATYKVGEVTNDPWAAYQPSFIYFANYSNENYSRNYCQTKLP